MIPIICLSLKVYEKDELMLDWLPENISTYGGRIDDVIRTIYYIVGVWFVLTEAVLFYFIVRYRRSRNPSAHYQPGTSWKALAWILLPAVLILWFDLAIDIVQAPVWREIKETLPPSELTVRITGKQFVWEIVHPGPDGDLDTEDDIETLNELAVPVHSKVQFELEAADVVHSLWIPHMRLKQDAVPGRRIKGWFEATKEGVYPIACAELCGSGHNLMQGRLRVMDPAGYQDWLKENIQELVSHAK